MKILQSPIFIIVCTVASVLLVIFLITRLIKKKKKEKELVALAEDKFRDEILTKNLTNKKNQNSIRQNTPIPYKIEYSEKTSDKETLSAERFSGIMVQIIEDRDLSIRKYILNPENTILIGKIYGENTISVKDAIVDIGQCEIFAENNILFARDRFSSNATLLKRKKNSTVLTAEGIQVISGDKIIIGSVTFTIKIIK